MPNLLRPLSTGELLDSTFTIYRRNFLLFATIFAIPYLPVLATQLVMQYTLASGRQFGPNAVISSVVAWLIGILVSLLMLAIAQGAAVNAVSSIYLGEQTSVSASFAAIKSKIGILLAVFIVTYLLIGLAALCFLVPGIYFLLRWALVIPVTALEDVGVAQARHRSSFLTDGHMGRIFIILLLYVVLLYAIALFVESPLVAVILVQSMHAAQAGAHNAVPTWYLPIVALADFIVKTVVSPFLLIALSLAYYDGRVRKEGYDLQLMMDSASPGLQSASSAGAASI